MTCSSHICHCLNLTVTAVTNAVILAYSSLDKYHYLKNYINVYSFQTDDRSSELRYITILILKNKNKVKCANKPLQVCLNEDIHI